MRGWFLTVRDFEVVVNVVYLTLSEPYLTRVKSYFWTVIRMKPFLPNRAQRPDKECPTWNFMENLMVPKMWLRSLGFKSGFKNMNIQEYLKKILHFSALLNVCFLMERSKLKSLSTEKLQKILGIQPSYGMGNIDSPKLSGRSVTQNKFWRVIWRIEEKTLISMRIAWTHSILRIVENCVASIEFVDPCIMSILL